TVVDPAGVVAANAAINDGARLDSEEKRVERVLRINGMALIRFFRADPLPFVFKDACARRDVSLGKNTLSMNGGVADGMPRQRSTRLHEVLVFLAVFLTAVLLAVLAPDLAAAFFAAVLRAVFFTALAGVSAAVFVVFLAAVLPALAGRGSNSKPTLPSGWRTRKALNLRLVRLETKFCSRSVLPSWSSLVIWAASISCCKMTLPERRSQDFSGPTDFSQT